MRVSHFPSVDALPESSRDLLDESGRSNPFSSVAWYRNFVETVAGATGDVTFLVAEEGEERNPHAILPLWRKPAARLGAVRILHALGNYYTCLYEPVVCAERTSAHRALDAIVGHIVGAVQHWDVVDLVPMAAEDWRLGAIRDAFVARGLATFPYFAFGNWYLECEGMSFDDYFRTRGSSTRTRVRSKRRQLEKRFRLEMSVICDKAELEPAIRHYNAVYALSWKEPEPYPKFMPGLIRLSAAQGSLRLGLMFLDGRAVAAQVWLVVGGVAHIYKLAYDPEFSEYSVGTLLTMKLFEHVLDVDHVHCIDYLSGDDEYKSRWMSHRRERQGLEIINHRSIRGGALALRRFVGRIKRRLRGAEPVPPI